MKSRNNHNPLCAFTVLQEPGAYSSIQSTAGHTPHSFSHSHLEQILESQINRNAHFVQWEYAEKSPHRHKESRLHVKRILVWAGVEQCLPHPPYCLNRRHEILNKLRLIQSKICEYEEKTPSEWDTNKLLTKACQTELTACFAHHHLDNNFTSVTYSE